MQSRLFEQKTILDLCAGSGAWSKPYRNAGYDVRLITLPKHDIRHYQPPTSVHGILCAPPCTHFSSSGAQYWKTKDQDGRTLEDLEIITHALKIIATTQPKWWCIENPVGRLKRWLGPPNHYFNQNDYGDPYTKKTCLWGKFTMPPKHPVTPIKTCKQGSWTQKLGGNNPKTKYTRSITPQGFAQGYCQTNPEKKKKKKKKKTYKLIVTIPVFGIFVRVWVRVSLGGCVVLCWLCFVLWGVGVFSCFVFGCCWVLFFMWCRGSGFIVGGGGIAV